MARKAIRAKCEKAIEEIVTVLQKTQNTKQKTERRTTRAAD